ncbi:dirigent protein 19-like [Canna indica]|uniref:Dirigent protein n=1 Tax=Canna indica TaxID=4628 RepID=A0AAQ3QL01_9LILI|nr:dirigent protein 19-like [Canna indica]
MLKLLHLWSLLLPLLIAVHNASSSSSISHHHTHDRMKSLHFSLFQQETINKTAFIVVDGVKGANVSQTTTPFGTIYVFRDNMTVSSDVSSRVAGVCEGGSITSSFDGLRSMSLAKITLKVKGLRGSVSILGGTHNTKPADHPVVGGTGDFMFAQGYVTSSPVELQGMSVVYKIEFHIYWPPYAAK